MNITIQFDSELNISVQPTDILYATLLTGEQSGVNHSRGTETPIAIGEIKKANHGLSSPTLEIETNGYPSVTITDRHYLFFSKNKAVNTSGLVGYYALTEYRNYSKKAAEIFATGAEYSPSSK